MEKGLTFLGEDTDPVLAEDMEDCSDLRVVKKVNCAGDETRSGQLFVLLFGIQFASCPRSLSGELMNLAMLALLKPSIASDAFRSNK
jgi:hypothetical protein